MRLLALIVACVGSVTLAGPTRAQDKPDDVGFSGLQQYTSKETGILFFFEIDADAIDGIFGDMREAIRRCNRYEYDSALDSLKRIVSYLGYKAKDPDRDKAYKGRAQRDADNAEAALAKVPRFPDNCQPPAGKPTTPPSPSPTPTPTPTPTPAPGAKLPDCVANDPEVRAAQKAADLAFSQYAKAGAELADAQDSVKAAVSEAAKAEAATALANAKKKEAEAGARVDQAEAAIGAAIKRAKERCADKNQTGLPPVHLGNWLLHCSIIDMQHRR